MVRSLSGIATALLLAILGDSLAQDTPPRPRTTPPELRGGPAHFPERDEDAYEFLPPLADWDAMDRLNEQGITSYRVFGFDQILGFGEFAPDGPLDFTGRDPVVLAALNKLLRSGFCRRPAISDLSHSGGGVGGGAHIGVIEIRTPQERAVIGVSQVGFFWGTFHGSSHQQFESWGLAMILDDLLFQKIGKRLDPKILDELTGDANRKRQQEILAENRKSE